MLSAELEKRDPSREFGIDKSGTREDSWLLAVGCWLLAVGSWLLAFGCWQIGSMHQGMHRALKLFSAVAAE